MPRAADKPHNRAIFLLVFALVIFVAFTVPWDFGDLVYVVAIFVITTYVSSLMHGRDAFYMFSHPGQEIKLEGQKLIVRTLKTQEETTYPIEDFQAYQIKTIFRKWQLNFIYDVIGDVHLLPKAKHKLPVKLIKIRDYKGLGEALQRVGLEAKA